ncbi:hypothetical protein FN846DRAFT_1023857 [Sphaerosporella brunnea]|uniref:Uncharacterized protein n=1 Tax=Sphaerosporella brunnea TaxID=1250544 RepID=A0A5J5ELT8_9PEZI|nr:hypothetical protein FN846DRAFT_1023857 [Sphaerosporella brunnea]
MSSAADDDSGSEDMDMLSSVTRPQPLLGVKTEGNESDPFAFLAVINLHGHASNPAIQTLASYILAKSASLHQCVIGTDPNGAFDQYARAGRAADVQDAAGGD